jgi:hypothetical protein
MWSDMNEKLMILLNVDKTEYGIFLFTFGALLGIMIGARIWG